MNSKPQELVDRFVQLRAQGLTFAAISRELNVSKTTLIAWSRKLHCQINNLRALEHEALMADLKLSRRACIENLASDLRRVQEEIERRTLEQIPTARLLTLSAKLRAEAERLTGPIGFAEPVPDTPEAEQMYPDPEVKWNA